MKKIFLILTIFLATSAHAMPCPKPEKHPEGADVYPTCGSIGIFRQNALLGFFDTQSGEVLAPAQFDAVQDNYVSYVSELTPVRKGEYWAYVNHQGQEQTPYEYEYAAHFHYKDALAIVRKKSVFGMIDQQMQIVVPFEYESMGGFLPVPERNGGKYAYITSACKIGIIRHCGFLNEKGEVVIPFIYRDVGDFDAPIAPVMNEAGKWGYINLKGEVVQDFVYDVAPSFGRYRLGAREFDCVKAQKDGKEVIIDFQGKILPENTICAPLSPPRI